MMKVGVIKLIIKKIIRVFGRTVDVNAYTLGDALSAGDATFIHYICN